MTRLFLFLLVFSATAQAAPPPPPPLARLAFMAGCWRGPDGDGIVEERIGPADADVMLSTARYLTGTHVTNIEFLRIEAKTEGVIMYPYPRGKPSTAAFKLKAGDDGNAIFEDPTHEFPKRVIYRRDGKDGLIGRIEGDDPGKFMEWKMKRCSE